MDRGTLDLIEFNKLLGRISTLAVCEASRREVTHMMPLTDADDIRLRQGRIAEIMRMLQEGDPLRLYSFRDLAPFLSKVKPEGAVLDAAELAAFIPALDIAGTVADQVRRREDIPLITAMTKDLTGHPHLLKMLNRSVGLEGDILDSASFLLADLRERIRRLDAKIVRKLEEIVRDERISVFLQDDFVTKRSGRWVIPVRMDSKGQVAGVVHDVSKSGETAFMEPLAIIGLANEMENLVAEQKAEEIRILRELSSEVRTDAGGIEAEFRCLVLLDSLNCIARFGDDLSMALPEISEAGILRLFSARHPLLELAFKDSGAGRSVVPLDVALGGDSTVMVITGSNAGGKTIAIKTIGLLVAMALTGLPIPASASSVIPLVRDLLADIGDEQSIEANLSTFAAHVEHIAGILEHADSTSMVLIDELGTGTDPSEGAALACAVLNELKASGALVFATTHLADIKGFVHRTEGMTNASMEFDQKTLTPLYRLRIGEPGQSYALETAARYGLPERVIRAARSMLGSMKVEFDNLVADLNIKRAACEEKLRELDIRTFTLAEKEKGLAEIQNQAEAREREILKKAYSEASDIVRDVKRQMNALLEESKLQEKAGRREAAKKAEALQRQLAARLQGLQDEEGIVLTVDDIAEGDSVFVKPLGRQAVVLKVSAQDRRVRVLSESREIDVAISDLRKHEGGAPRPHEAGISSQGPEEMLSSRISLLGLRVDEAISQLEPFLNHASLAGLTEVVIIHGIGTGALSRAVREHLKGHPLVSSYRGGEQSEGGAGITVVTLI